MQADRAAVAIRPDRLRQAMGHFATGVAVVTSVDAEGRPVGTTANAITSLSLEPPLILACFARESNTLRALCRHRAFAINILATEHREMSTGFARPGAAGVDWERIGHHHGATGSPRFHGALASLDCAVERLISSGDHEIVIGRVLEVRTVERDRRPLLFYRGEYVSLERP
jgi:3-hydroxy-9,10-secoandrosta-1,3,5(10)-triene-9,17-dione monooxygenase reductase component